MKENKITVIIDKPLAEVFEFTTNPKNTHLWIPSISEEIADEYPPKINTKYRNRGNTDDWNEYKVMDFQKNKVFILFNVKDAYFVKYTYHQLDNNKTELEYFEWMTTGELTNPFTEDILENLKKVMEG
ncbi:MAG: hypothetical protein ACKUBY_03920 [Candidatus Moraniibacteriota bacterium]|jgi:hypothetical protein